MAIASQRYFLASINDSVLSGSSFNISAARSRLTVRHAKPKLILVGAEILIITVVPQLLSLFVYRFKYIV